MRWDRLFADLEGQLAHEYDAEQVDLAAEDERLRLARLTLRERLAALAHPEASAVRLALRDGTPIALRPAIVGRDWVGGELEVGGSAIVPLDAIAGVLPDPAQLAALTAASAAADLSARLGLGFALRDLCRRRAAVDIETLAGGVHGTIDRVGRDHVDLAEHERGAHRRGSDVMRTRIVPLAVVLLVRY